ncbi:hypothetical protein [Loktanella sp. S4079]|uniref:hypothetical protein n=1 Tax=Loktanella sp. S4079 TaxID=579483 RepID=UPI0005FA029D|nr:hypothetical protein [Loktanella sp. S4079]KJZ19783.1 hypothetical protein TW80_02515 [Loktanella sp. S4079]
MRHQAVTPLTVTFAVLLASSLHGYAVEPAPHMLSELESDALLDHQAEQTAEVCEMEILPDPSSADAIPSGECHAVGF